MPDILREPHRAVCLGLDLVHPVDRMPEGAFPYLLNMRVLQEGRLEARPGYGSYDSVSSVDVLHSIRRLNDVAEVYASSGYTNIVGNGTTLWAGPQGSLAQIDTGYSGLPLSLITFRPQNSPDSWMYVYDQNKSAKIRPDGVVRDIGAAPPGPPLVATYGQPEEATIFEASSSVASWLAYGAASTPSVGDRTNSGAPTIANIVYDSGTTGWCCINPTSVYPFVWSGNRMRVILQTSTELVAVREIHGPIQNTVITRIKYDDIAAGTGPCSIVLAGSPVSTPNALERNSLIEIDSEIVKVQAIVMSPDGITYSIRCTTAVNHANGAAVTGLLSWYCYTINTHAAGETITAPCVFIAQAGAGTGSAARLVPVNAATTAQNGRPISTANDYLHFSIYLQNPQNVTQINLMIDINPNTTTIGSGGNAFTADYWTWIIPGSSLISADQPGSLGDTWFEILIPIASGTQVGTTYTLNFSDIEAVQIQVVSTGACSWGFTNWYFFGTYGPFVQPNSPAGLLYQSTCRDSTTGAASVPGPTPRYPLFPLNEEVVIVPATSTEAGIDSLDIYRQGNTLTSPVYVGTVANITGGPIAFDDTQNDTAVESNPGPDLTLLQPWPVLKPARSGVVNVVGTDVQWVSGDLFDPDLVQDTVITLNGVAFLTYGQPLSTTALQIVSDAGVIGNATYEIASPTLAAQPLPYAFGPLEGPFAPVVFALGDPDNAGTLYYSNSANADGASDNNTLELCAPGEPLVSGEVWNGICIVGSHDNIFVVRYSYLTTIGVVSGGPVIYQFLRIPAGSGMWCRWGCTRGVDGVYYIGRDGIYRATDQAAVNISDDLLYPLFPHDGQPATATNGFNPVDMTQLTTMRLTRGDQCVKFWYTDIMGNRMCMRYEYTKKRWFPAEYADKISVDYLVEESETTPDQMQVLFLSSGNGLIYLEGGYTDNSGDDMPFTPTWTTPSYDQGDERLQKLYVDTIHDFDQAGAVSIQFGFNNNTILGPVLVITTGAARQQYIDNIASLSNLALYRNICANYTLILGAASVFPRCYAFEYAGYAQPYISTRIVTQFIPLGYPGWKHHRRLYPGLISNSAILFTIQTQDGRTYGPITIPSTAGQFRIVPIMLPQAIKDLAFAYQLDGQGQNFALFPEAFTIETKEWQQPDYTNLAVFKS